MQGLSIRRMLLVSCLFGPFFVVDAEMSWADCTPDPPADGDTVTCSNSDNDGFIAPANSSHAINVEQNGTVQTGIGFSGSGNIGVDLRGSLNGNITGNGSGIFTFGNGGNFNGGITITGTGNNAITNYAGHNVNGLAGINGADNLIENLGTFNQGLVLSGTGSNTVNNYAGAQINQTFTITGDGRNRLDNSGIVNNGLTITGNGINLILNRPGATINHDLTSIGSANDIVDNQGLFNNAITLEAGADLLVNRTPAATINGTINMGAGSDLFFMFDGRVNNSVFLGPDRDMAVITGGEITQSVNTEGGADDLIWTGGHIGSLNMGTENDNALFRNLTTDNLRSGVTADGGLGYDQLYWSNTKAGEVARYINWELIDLTGGSEMTFANSATLTLGDSGTATGALVIDPSSTVLAGDGNHNVSPFTSGALTTVQNAGLIDLTNGSGGTNDRFTITGNYDGQNGRVGLNTYLGTDGSPSDQIIIANGRAFGSTSLLISNAGGPGALTTGDGILVIGAINGASTDPGAFALGAPVGAGPFEYSLFRSGDGAGTESNWYLRTDVEEGGIPSPPTGPVSPPTTLPQPIPAAVFPLLPVPARPVQPTTPNTRPPITPVTPPTLPAIPSLPPALPIAPLAPITALPPVPPAPPSGRLVPNIRPEIPGYTLAPLVAQQLGLHAIGTFDDRRGDQTLLDGETALKPVWGRFFGATAELGWEKNIFGGSYNLGADFDGSYWGLQTGLDLYGMQHENGHVDRFGTFYSHANAHGDIYGNVLGMHGIHTGTLDLDQDALGLYWTHTAPNGWYVDLIGMYGWLNGSASSLRGIGADLDGHSLAASIETGVPIPLDETWSIEPQAQLVWQSIGLDDAHDRFASISYDDFDTVTGRIGARVKAATNLGEAKLVSHVGVNLWHGFDDSGTVAFNSFPFAIETGGTALELNGGTAVELNRNVSLYANVSYAFDVKETSRDSFGAEVGLRVRW